MICEICRNPTPGVLHERCKDCQDARAVMLAFLRRGGGAALGVVQQAITETEPDRQAAREREAAKVHTPEEQREYRRRRAAWKR